MYSALCQSGFRNRGYPGTSLWRAARSRNSSRGRGRCGGLARWLQIRGGYHRSRRRFVDASLCGAPDDKSATRPEDDRLLEGWRTRDGTVETAFSSNGVCPGLRLGMGTEQNGGSVSIEKRLVDGPGQQVGSVFGNDLARCSLSSAGMIIVLAAEVAVQNPSLPSRLPSSDLVGSGSSSSTTHAHIHTTLSTQLAAPYSCL